MVWIASATAFSGACAVAAEDEYATNQFTEPGEDGSAGASGKGGGSAGGSTVEGGSAAGSGGFAGDASAGEAATGTCDPGDINTFGPCGKCGTLTQQCASGDWGPETCVGEGACTPGEHESQACTGGAQERECSGSCAWGSWGTCASAGVCAPGATESEGCGNCGSHSRTCDSAGQWSVWGACQNQGECTIGQTASEPCGNCGTRKRTCGSTCQWGSFGSCSGEGVCSPGATQDCMCSQNTSGTSACCGRQVCSGTCQWGTCGLKPTSECDWNGGHTYQCCGAGMWQWCLSSCTWSDQCASCSSCC